MSGKYRRISILIISFLGAFILIVGLGKLQSGYSLFDFLKGKKEPSDEKVHLAKSSPVLPSDVPTATRLSQEFAAVSKAVMPSIVSINTTGTQRLKKVDRSGRTSIIPDRVTGQGSGVIATEEGHIITNHHVVANVQKIIVTLYNGAEFEAILIGADPSLDIAVLKIESPLDLRPLKFGNSDKVREGHLVMAFGNPFGIGSSMTNGIISARRSSRSDVQTTLFQTNVAINQGNSGGPLVNVIGEMIGINSSIYSSDKENPGFQGISFAIPGNLVKKSLLDILEFQRPMRGYLGFHAEDLLIPGMRNQGEYQGVNGVKVSKVEPNSPAAKGDLQKGDVILSFAGNKVDDKVQLMQQIQSTRVGDKINVQVMRGDELLGLNVILEEIDVGVAYLKQKQYSQEVNRSILKVVGINAVSLSPDYGINGVRVTSILPGSLAENAIKEGDIIYRVNNNRVYHTAHLTEMILALAPQGETHFYVIREGERLENPIIFPQVNRS